MKTAISNQTAVTGTPSMAANLERTSSTTASSNAALTSANPGGSIVSSAKFSESSVALKTLGTRCNLPAIVRLTSSAPGVTVQTAVKCEETGRPVERTPIYVHSVHSIRNIVAESVKIRENLSRKTSIVSTSSRYAIPTSYEGLFEVLSADGRAVKPMTTIEELYRCAPSKFLLREPLKGQYANENGQITNSDKQRTIAAHEVLRIDGVTNCVSQSLATSNQGRRMLRCRDCLGQTVFFAFDQRCLVSPVAGATNISGVHDIRQLIEKFRLPVHVRLVSGQRPADKSFTACFKLSKAYTAETAFCLPLKKDSAVLPMSLRPTRSVRVHLATNYSSSRLLASSECRQYASRCIHTIQLYANSMHTLIPGGAADRPCESDKVKVSRSKVTRRSSTAVSKQRFQVARDRRASCDVKHAGDDQQDQCDNLFDQIDDIYRYVRDGGVVPTSRDLARAASIASPPYSESSSSSSSSTSSSSSAEEQGGRFRGGGEPYLSEGRRGSQFRNVVRSGRSASFNTPHVHDTRKPGDGFVAVADQLANQQRRQQTSAHPALRPTASSSPPQTLTEFFGGAGIQALTLSDRNAGQHLVSNPSNVAVKERTVRFVDSPPDDDVAEDDSGESSPYNPRRRTSQRSVRRGSVPNELLNQEFSTPSFMRQSSVTM